MKFGLNTLLYSGTFTDNNLDIFKELKDIGFDGVEIALEKKGDLDYKKTLEALEENGLECCAVCGLFGPDRDLRGPDKAAEQNGLSYIRDCVDACKALKCDLFTGPIYSCVGRAEFVEPEQKKEQWSTAVSNLKEACKYAENNNVFLGLEPLNRFETDFINICSDAHRMVEDVGSDKLKIHLDAFHMNIEEKDSAEAIRQAGGLLYHFHASENDRGTPGTGQVHWGRIRDALVAIGYERYVVIESFTPNIELIARAASIWRETAKSEYELAKNGLDFLKNLLG